MDALRLLLIALGCLFTIAACGALVGFVLSAVEESASPAAHAWLVFIATETVLVSLAAGAFCLARRIARRQRERTALESEASVELFCPQCNSNHVVQGPEKVDWLFRTSYIARCLGCGQRLDVSREDWRTLPLPEVGDAFETWGDKRHLTRRAPMTAGQIVIVLLGIVGFFTIVFLTLGDIDVELLGIVFLAIMFGCWWLGRLLFRPRRGSP